MEQILALPRTNIFYDAEYIAQAIRFCGQWLIVGKSTFYNNFAIIITTILSIQGLRYLIHWFASRLYCHHHARAFVSKPFF